MSYLLVLLLLLLLFLLLQMSRERRSVQNVVERWMMCTTSGFYVLRHISTIKTQDTSSNVCVLSAPAETLGIGSCVCCATRLNGRALKTFNQARFTPTTISSALTVF